MGGPEFRPSVAAVLQEAEREFEARGMTEHISERIREVLTREELLTIFEWTRDKDVSDTFRKVNSALFGGREQTAFTRVFAETLNRALGKLPVLRQQIVYRGVVEGIIPNLEEYQEGALIRWRGFTATSKVQEKAFGRADVEVRFIILQNSARDLEPLSANGSIRKKQRNEKEALIRAGRSFRVLRRRDQPDSTLQITLEEITDGR